jgi:hypothetical protein
LETAKHNVNFSNTLGKVFDHDKVEDVLLLECLVVPVVVQGQERNIFAANCELQKQNRMDETRGSTLIYYLYVPVQTSIFFGKYSSYCN